MNVLLICLFLGTAGNLNVMSGLSVSVHMQIAAAEIMRNVLDFSASLSLPYNHRATVLHTLAHML